MEIINEIRQHFKLPLNELILKADNVCRKIHGNKVYIRGLIEFSNVCTMDCHYCGIRKSNTNTVRYRMDEDEILSIVQTGYQKGIRTFVLQSGEDPEYTTKRLCTLADKIKNATLGEAALTLSCGMRTKDQFKELKNSGCDRYLMRFETSDETIYKSIRSGLKLSDRIRALKDLKDLGFETGSGFMVGLPGETEETRIQNVILSAKLELDMAGIGPFIPHPETPLKEAAQNPIELTIQSTAALRLALPKANLPATTAAGSLDPIGREKMLSAGANVLMPNITPVDHKKDYLLYPGKICLDESGFECIGCLSLRVKSIGKELSFDRGDSKSWGPCNAE